MEKTLRGVAVVVVGILLVVTGPVRAANYSWTNTVSGASGYWTNGILWNNVASVYPGSSVSDTAYLTNQFSGSATTILDSKLAASISTLAISNAPGAAWLILTNGASSPIVTNATFSLGSGGRLQIDNGGVLSNTTTFNWVGTNGIIYLNQGGQLITARAAGIAIGSGSGGVTALVSSVSGVGNGGVWEMTTKGLTVGNSTDGNMLRITGGAVVTNAGSITMSGNRNSLLVTDGGQLNGAGAITFGTANYGNTVTLESGFWNLGAQLQIGFASNSSNNTFTIVGGIVSNATSLYVGGNSSAGITGANYNSLVVTNGGRFVMTSGHVYVGAAILTSNADGPGGGNNTVILSNSVLNLSSGFRTDIGFGSSNNTVTLLADTFWDNATKPIWLGVGTPTYNNVLNVAGGLLTNVTGLYIGGTTTAGSTLSNRLVVSHGGIVSNVTDVRIGSASGANYNSLVVTNGGRLFISGGQLVVGSGANGAVGGGNNSLLLSNSLATLTAAGNSYIGSSSTNNSVTFLTDTVINGQGSALNIGIGAGVGNRLTVDGGILTNIGAIAVGTGAGGDNSLIVTNGGQLRTTAAIWIGQSGSSSNQVIIAGGSLPASSTVVSNGGAGFTALAIGQGSSANMLTIDNAMLDNNGGGVLVGYNPGGHSNQVVIRNGGILTNVTNLRVGIGAANAGSSGEDDNSFIVTNGGRFFMKAGSVWVGAWGTLTGGGNNSVILSNSLLTTTAPTYIGSGSSNNTMIVLADTVWDNRNQGIILGHRTASVANELNIAGGLLTNAGLLTVGNASGASSNRIVVSAGGVISNVTGISISIIGGAGYNQLIVTNGGRLMMVTAGNFSVGSALNTTVGGGNNTVILSNSVVLINGSPCVGCGSSNNAVTFLADTVVNGGNAAFLIGNGAATGNSLTLDGGLFTNVSSVTVGTGTAMSNSVAVRNGARLFAGGVTVGDSGAAFNSLTISNATVTSSGGFVAGINAASNTVTILGSSTVNLLGNSLRVGAGAGTGNTLTINQGIVTNSGFLVVGGPGGANNNLIITNGGQLWSAAYSVIGNTAGANSNTVTVAGNNALWNLGGGSLTNGSINTTGNVVTVNSGGLITNAGAIIVGHATASTGNRLVVTNGGKLFGGAVTVGSGSGARSNHLSITDGGQIFVGNLTVGTAGANDNSALVANGGVLQASGLIIGSGTGNTISNVNATFQFTAAPTITSLTPGDIAITDGTISFRATGVANVTNTAANQISKIQFAGANTFQLNNASNTAATVSQKYTFDAIPGNPSNYVNLVMVNGPTAYGNANGAGITIGSAGTFLASNTVAIIAGTFTNNGTAEIVDATVNFQSALDVAGTLTLRTGFVTGTSVKTVGGTLRGNGTVVGDLTVTGDVSPGLSDDGTLVFSNNLTLAGSYQAEFGDGGNDQLIVVGDLTLAGATLDLTAGGLTGAAYVIASYEDLFGTFSVTNGMPVGYTLDYSYSGNQIAIVVVPEPETLGLVGLGMVAMFVVSRWRRR